MSRCSLPNRWSAETPCSNWRSASESRSTASRPSGDGLRVVDEVDAAHQLHGEEAAPLLDHQLVQADHVRMRHVGEPSKLLLQAVDPRTGQVPQGLERDDLAALAILDFIDHAHSAGAEAPDQPEAFRSRELVVFGAEPQEDGSGSIEE